MGGEVTDRAVTPVVGQSLVVQEALVDDVMHGHQLHGGDPEVPQILDRRVGSESRVGAPVRFGDVGMADVKPLTCVS